MSAASASTSSQPHKLDSPPLHVPPHCIAILDAGAQYSKVIDRRVRELQVEAHLLPLSTPVEQLKDYAALILSGGPQSVYDSSAPLYDARLFDGVSYTKPILGICYGMQLLIHACGGEVTRGGTREDGQFAIEVASEPEVSQLYSTLPSTIDVLLTHGDSVTKLAPGFRVTASSPSGIIASVENTTRHMYGVQYHPEVDLTPQGNIILQNFLQLICQLPRSFTLLSRKHSAIKEIRKQVGEKSKVLCLLSGGVDSSVCAALLKEAIGAERIIAIHIDNGFMRLNESVRVVSALEHIGLHVHLIDARDRFYNGKTSINGQETSALNDTTLPEVKRKIIGDTFMRVSEEELIKLGLKPDDVFLAQGTLRPDLIESASSIASVANSADVIKTHHNDTALVRELRKTGRIVEPLSDLHKDEVRLLGLELGLPSHLIWRQPFPGPGLAVRIICSLTPFTTGLEEKIVQDLKTHETEKIHASLLACRTVGVQGDCRSYSALVALSSKHPVDSNSPNWHSLFHLAKQIPKTVHGVNRVVYVFGEPLKKNYYNTITRTLLTPDAIEQLQKADEIVNQVLLKYQLMKSLSQVPVILFPVDFDESDVEQNNGNTNNKGMRSICIRTFITNDFMTGVPALPIIDQQHNIVQGIVSPSPSPQPSSASATPNPADDVPQVSKEDTYTQKLAPVAASHSSSTVSPTLPSPQTDTLHVPPSSSHSHSSSSSSHQHQHSTHIPLSSSRFPTMPLSALQEMVAQILAEVPMIARVCFDMTSKPPATTEWE